MRRKGIIMAGGLGTRLFPTTIAINKHLQMLYDKPMLYYPLSILMLADIRRILIISSPRDLPLIKLLFPDSGKSLGLEIEFAVQANAGGVAQAFILAETFLSGSPSVLILGDNIFHGAGIPKVLKNAAEKLKDGGAMIFTYIVSDPTQYGVLIQDESGKPIDIIEKPRKNTSNQAITGLYYYDSNVVEIAKSIAPSARAELEISSVNKEYLKRGALQIQSLDAGITWLDTGTPDALLQASNYISDFENTQGTKVACLEEIAWRQGWITREKMLKNAQTLNGSNYGMYLQTIGMK